MEQGGWVEGWEWGSSTPGPFHALKNHAKEVLFPNWMLTSSTNKMCVHSSHANMWRFKKKKKNQLQNSNQKLRQTERVCMHQKKKTTINKSAMQHTSCHHIIASNSKWDRFVGQEKENQDQQTWTWPHPDQTLHNKQDTTGKWSKQKKIHKLPSEGSQCFWEISNGR